MRHTPKNQKSLPTFAPAPQFILFSVFGLLGLVGMTVFARPAYAVPICVDCTQPISSNTLSGIESALARSGALTQIFAPTLSSPPATDFVQQNARSLSEQLMQFTPQAIFRASLSPDSLRLIDAAPMTDFNHLPSPARDQANPAFGQGAGGASPEYIGQMMRANAFPGVFEAPGAINAVRISEGLSRL